jgi:hypothetical protein
LKFYPSHSDYVLIPSKMTIITNHRITSYKKARRLSPTVVKTPCKVQPLFNKKRNTTLEKLMAAVMYAQKITKAAPTPHPSPVLRPAASAPLAKMTQRVVYVWDKEYVVEIPAEFDIYEGLRRWYPDLYRAVMQEEELIRAEPSTPPLSEEEMEEAWARYEYLEYLSDY